MEQVISIPSNVLWGVCEEQKKLITFYKEIEGLPDYPVNLSVKKNQKLIKDFVGRFTEELSEAFHFSTLAYDAVANNDREKALEYVKEYNMEMGDAISFFIELMIYLNLDAHKFEMQGFSFLQDKNCIDLYTIGKPWTSIRHFVKLTNSEELGKFINSFSNYQIPDDHEMPFLAGEYTSWGLLEEQAKALWNVTHQMYRAVNHLKHRDWTQGEKDLNILGFQQEFFKGVLNFVYYLELSGHNDSKFYLNYMTANKKNHERIKSKY